MSPGARLMLASTSPARRALMENAGLAFEATAPELDEQAVKEALGHGAEPVPAEDVAMILARAKAEAVAGARAGDAVIAADQVLELDSEILDKPVSRAAARAQLIRLRGRSHLLHTAAVCAIGGKIVWDHGETARLTMHEFSNRFLGEYMAAEGDAVTESVGGYKIEGRGIRLFSAIEGDYFAILGLPLLPLLAFLRARELIDT